MMETIDLHVHTDCSDGTYSAGEIAVLARSGNINILSVTDHDTVGAVEETRIKLAGSGICFIPGIEFSVEYNRGELHLLGYGIDHMNAEITETVRELSLSREQRAKNIVSQFKDAGFDIEFDEVSAMASRSDAIGKPHVARVLIEKGYVNRIDQAFRRFFHDGLPGDVPKKKLSLEKAVELINAAGGIPILAHPGSLDLSEDEFIIKINEYMEAGIKGIEVYASMHSRREVRFFERIANEKDLLVTGGSDFHGDRRERLGYFGRRKIDSGKIRKFLETAGIRSICGE